MSFLYNHFVADYNKISDNIYLGNLAGAQNKKFLEDNNITHIINLSYNSYPQHSGIKYLIINIPDSPDQNIKQHFDKVIKFFDDAINNNGNVYIHCKAGISRSTTCLIAYLMYKGLNMCDSVNYVRSKRLIIEPNSGFWIQLMIFERELYGKNSVGYKENYY